MSKRIPIKRREPLTDTMLLVTITIGIFFAMYFSAMAIWGGGFLRWQRVFDMLNDNAALIIVACGLTIVMIGGGIDISVGGVIALVVMSCVVHLNSGGSIVTAALLAVGIGLAFGLMQGFDTGLVNYCVRAGGLCQRLEDTLHRVTLHHAAVGTECFIINGQNLHGFVPPCCIGNDLHDSMRRAGSCLIE